MAEPFCSFFFQIFELLTAIKVQKPGICRLRPKTTTSQKSHSTMERLAEVEGLEAVYNSGIPLVMFCKEIEPGDHNLACMKSRREKST